MVKHILTLALVIGGVSPIFVHSMEKEGRAKHSMREGRGKYTHRELRKMFNSLPKETQASLKNEIKTHHAELKNINKKYKQQQKDLKKQINSLEKEIKKIKSNSPEKAKLQLAFVELQEQKYTLKKTQKSEEKAKKDTMYTLIKNAYKSHLQSMVQ